MYKSGDTLLTYAARNGTTCPHQLSTLLAVDGTLMLGKLKEKVRKLKEQKNINMQPLFENVLVKVDSREEKSDIYETVAKDNELLTGTVIGVGSGSVEWPKMAVKVGDRIRWHRNAGEKEMIDGVLHRFLNERKGDIIAIL